MPDNAYQLSDHALLRREIAYWQGTLAGRNPEITSAQALLEAALDIETIRAADGTLTGALVLVTAGGPNIWIDTRFDRVLGWWGSEHIAAPYSDRLGLNEAIADLYADC